MTCFGYKVIFLPKPLASNQSPLVYHPKMSEKLCLKWNDFQDNTNTAFGSLRNDNDFSDVTLACEDGQQFEAHKVILAAASPFFENIIRRNKHPHPLIYMRGVKSEDLVAIVDFLYCGEANVYQENLDAFLTIAEEISLKGLTKNDGQKTNEETEPKRTKSKAKSCKLETENLVFNFEEPNHTEPNTAPSRVSNRTVALQNNAVTSVSITDVQELHTETDHRKMTCAPCVEKREWEVLSRTT